MTNPQNPSDRKGVTRREFVAGAVATVGSLALPGCGESRPGGLLSPAGVGATLPAPKDSGIDHIVVVMMENRSFDHFLGWVPGADGVQAATTQKDANGEIQQARDLAPMFQNFEEADPDHTYEGGRIHLGEGRMDGFLLTQNAGDTFPIGYYTAASLPFYKGCAEHWTICDRYFTGILASTTPNRIYMHAGQTDRATNTVDISTLPTVWDRMLEAGRSVAYYYTDVSYTSFWGDKYLGFSKKYDLASFAADVAGGTLADLTFIDNVGSTLNEGSGISMDDHPYGDIRNGQAFLNQVYDALRQGRNWDRTLIVINYDEWGGFYDHVPPPLAPVTPEELAATGNDGRLGCRVPCVLIGPRVRRKHVEKRQYDPNSILNLIAWRFGFAPLGARANSNNIALALDFTSPLNLAAPAFEVPLGPFGQQCLPFGFFGGQLPVPTPGAPAPVCVPAAAATRFEPVPGLDVPLPASGDQAAASKAQRRDDHDQELETVRALGRRHGFDVGVA